MDTTWQTVATKRPRPNSPITTNNNNNSKRNREDPTTSTNQYDLLRIDDNDDETTPNSNNNNNSQVSPKPPPIIFPDVSKIHAMINTIQKVISSNDFYYKATNKNEVRLMVKDIDNYR